MEMYAVELGKNGADGFKMIESANMLASGREDAERRAVDILKSPRRAARRQGAAHHRRRTTGGLAVSVTRSRVTDGLLINNGKGRA